MTEPNEHDCTLGEILRKVVGGEDDEAQARAARYRLFCLRLGLGKMGAAQLSEMVTLLRSSPSLDHTRFWRFRGDRKTLVVTAEPYGGTKWARQARDTLRVVGFEAEIIPGVAIHHPSCTMAIAVYGLPGAAADLAEALREIDELRRPPLMEVDGDEE